MRAFNALSLLSVVMVMLWLADESQASPRPGLSSIVDAVQSGWDDFEKDLKVKEYHAMEPWRRFKSKFA
ncbi:hypothetical protein H4R34_004453 [Dimargaris verticillata]|uniref:Uncharacterized protein n=1 Tax=Dimargaris verticillata TaxID=2761393 RepID=A0A9W8E776_9FUNG|nr:hypothetical protein H4R34_004453 [Dimargaris verticillata]